MQQSVQFAFAPCCRLLLSENNTTVLRNQMLHSRQAVQRGPKWTKGGDAVTTNEITKLTTVQQLNIERVSFNHYNPVVTPRTLPSIGRSTKMGHTSQKMLWESHLLHNNESGLKEEMGPHTRASGNRSNRNWELVC